MDSAVKGRANFVNLLINRYYEVGSHIGNGRYSTIYNISNKYFTANLVAKVYQMNTIKHFLPNDIDINVLITEKINIVMKISFIANIVVFRDQICDRHNMILIMDHINGVKLSELIKTNFEENRQLSEAMIIQIISQLIYSIYRLSNIGVVHNNIYPNNIYLDTNDPNNVKVTIGDYKLSYIFDDLHFSVYNNLNNYKYLSPEQIKNSNDIDISTNDCIWSLGIIILELCVFSRLNASISEYYKIHSKQNSKIISNLFSDTCFSKNLVDLTTNCLKYNYKQRINIRKLVDLDLSLFNKTNPHSHKEKANEDGVDIYVNNINNINNNNNNINKDAAESISPNDMTLLLQQIQHYQSFQTSILRDNQGKESLINIIKNKLEVYHQYKDKVVYLNKRKVEKPKKPSRRNSRKRRRSRANDSDDSEQNSDDNNIDGMEDFIGDSKDIDNVSDLKSSYFQPSGDNEYSKLISNITDNFLGYICDHRELLFDFLVDNSTYFGLIARQRRLYNVFRYCLAKKRSICQLSRFSFADKSTDFLDAFSSLFELLYDIGMIRLTNCVFGPQTLQYFVNPLTQFQNLHFLEMSSSKLDDECFIYIVDHLGLLENLSQLVLSGNLVTDHGLLYLTDHQTSFTIKNLDLSHNLITDYGIILFKKKFRNIYNFDGLSLVGVNVKNKDSLSDIFWKSSLVSDAYLYYRYR